MTCRLPKKGNPGGEALCFVAADTAAKSGP